MKAAVVVICSICIFIAIQVAETTPNGNNARKADSGIRKKQKERQNVAIPMAHEPREYSIIKQEQNEIEKQIVGGAPATRGQFPWQAYIIIDKVSYCGGSLIHSDWVITAAHCTYKRSYFNVTLGTLDRAIVPSDGFNAITAEKYGHPKYSRGTLSNDVALIRLPWSVTYSAYISPIQLPSSINTYENFPATISGFGKIDNNTNNRYLNFAEVTVIPNDVCAPFYNSTLFSIVINSTICTRQPGKSTCYGDSGGPLAIKGDDGNWVLIGITSFGSAQGCLVAPSGFGRVSSFLPWISNMTGYEYLTTPAPITSSTGKPKKITPPKCDKVDFSTLHTCCLTQRNDLVDKRDPSCPAPNSYKAFNSYTVNKHQNSKTNFTINFSDTKVRKALGRDACLVGCYMYQHFLVSGEFFYEDDILEFLKKKNPSDPWKTRLSNAFSKCMQYVKINSIPPFLEGKIPCDGAPLVLMQCILMKSVGTCDRNMNTKCAPRWIDYDKCKHQIFNL